MHRETEHLAGTLEQLFRYWETRRGKATGEPAGTTTAFTIAISREAGTEATPIGQEVGNRLGWQVYDHALMERIAQDMGLRTTLLETVDERRRGWLQDTTEALLAPPRVADWRFFVTESGYVHHLVKTVLALGLQGECVIVGRGGPFILPAETTLRVRLVAPLRHRIATWARAFDISECEAARRVRSVDRERTDFVHDHFFKDPNDPQNYDLVLNTARYAVERSAQLIIEAFRQLQMGREGTPLAAGERPDPLPAVRESKG